MLGTNHKRADIERDNKGFTLVELIVVLVILAILAAILVPELLGYIDRAKESRYLVEAHSIYMGLQTLNVERSVRNEEHLSWWYLNADRNVGGKEFKQLNKLIAPAVFEGREGDIEGIGYMRGGELHEQTTKEQIHKYYTIKSIKKFRYRSSDGHYVTLTLSDENNWEVVNIE